MQEQSTLLMGSPKEARLTIGFDMCTWPTSFFKDILKDIIAVERFLN